MDETPASRRLHRSPPPGTPAEPVAYDPNSPEENQLLSRGRESDGRAVEQLLEEVETQAEPEPLVRVEGLRGRAAIVTGGSTGIGRAVGRARAPARVNVAFNYLQEDGEEGWATAERTAAELEAHEVEVFHRPVDCTDPKAVAGFVADALARFESLHILVNNAGTSRAGTLSELSGEDWEVVLRTNLSGTFYFIREVSPIFRKQEYGKIVNVSSVHGIRSEVGLGTLSASKAGILALTRTAALELGPANVNVNAVAPGYIRTSRLTRDVSAETLDRVRAHSALGRLGDPQDVADAVLFLCSEAARHITGIVLPVDGGYLL